MGFRFFRRLRIFPGLTVNLSKVGASLSVGARGAHVTFGRRGVRETVGIPGTGIYYTELIPRGARNQRSDDAGQGSQGSTFPISPTPAVSPASRARPQPPALGLPVPAGQASVDRRGEVATVELDPPPLLHPRRYSVQYSPWAQTLVSPAFGLLPAIAEEAQTLRSQTELAEFAEKLFKRAKQGLPGCPKHFLEIDWVETGCLKCNPPREQPQWHWMPKDGVRGGWMPGDKLRGGHWLPGRRWGVLWRLRNGEFRKLQPDPFKLWESKRWQTYYEDFRERMTSGSAENYPGEAQDVDRIRWCVVEHDILGFMKLVQYYEGYVVMP